MTCGPRSAALAARLRQVESPGVTTFSDGWPIFWERGQGARIWDVDGHEYIDLTAAFGVMSVGHANPRVAAALASQANTLLHGMGDVHPPSVKVQLLERLAALAPGDLRISHLGLNGADAVETALKCAELVTGRPGVIAFEGGYHGLASGALSVSSRRDFRDPFSGRLGGHTTFAPFPTTADRGREVIAELGRRLSSRQSGLPPTGAVIIEPIQGRGGIRVAPRGFLAGLRRLCDDFDLLLIVDEIFTGLGRTGRMFAVQHDGVVPDLLCIGKALGGGMPLSATIGSPRSLGRWPVATGESLHTATFLGHPGACAAALAALDELVDRDLPARALRLEAQVRDGLSGIPGASLRGRGLMLGLALDAPERALAATTAALAAGVLILPSGENGEVLSITPPLVITEPELATALDVLVACLQ